MQNTSTSSAKSAGEEARAEKKSCPGTELRGDVTCHLTRSEALIRRSRVHMIQ